jgi:preprotein translocase subunit SecA
MFGAIARRLFGTVNDRIVNRMRPTVAAINALEPAFEKLTAEELRGKTEEFKNRHAGGESLDDMLVEAFAAVREAAKRTLGQRHFDVQLMGGMVLHQGKISEMRTGEGKTLVSTLSVYLNALAGKGVHVVTVNDYLAERDSEWMGQIYRYLGMSVGCIRHGLDDVERQQAYRCDITYGTNSEMGFDYLRDNMKFRREELVQRDFFYAVVDEVDSILIDEARTPLIISGRADDSSALYRAVDVLIPRLEKGDYDLDEKQRTVSLTEAGVEKMEGFLKEVGIISEGELYDVHNVHVVHHLNQALRAHVLFLRDRDYLIKDGKVVIVDEFTGRMMEGRRFSEGLHQALEAKENVEIQPESQTLASITYQNFFRMYPKLAGMTGTAMTEASEFAEIYKLEVVEIPTNRDMIRKDADDEVYRTAREKYDAIIDLIDECQKRDQPVLVGTVSIEKSETLSELLNKRSITHSVLNARFHEQEAMIIAQAGRPGTITIATNMAGRGTDIQLGGNADMRIRQELADITDPEEFKSREAQIRAEIAELGARARAGGGLYVIGTERHESRRIDNQLRGRSGRQGDPGASKFFLSLEDDLMRIFGSDRIDGMLQKLGLKEGEAIVHAWINKALAKAQQKVEARNFEIRKQLLRYDDVMNDQRKVIYEQRRELMNVDDVSETIGQMREQIVGETVAKRIPPEAYAEQWDLQGLHDDILRIFELDLPIADWAKEEGIADEEIRARILDAVARRMAEKAANYGPDIMRSLERSVLLQVLDFAWKEHLFTLDHLRQGISLRAYAQRDPLNEYKAEAFVLFDEMLTKLRETVIRSLAHAAVRSDAPDDYELPSTMMRKKHVLVGPDGEPVLGIDESSRVDPDDPATWGRVARNAACPCGSGKKYKQCHGRLAV